MDQDTRRHIKQLLALVDAEIAAEKYELVVGVLEKEIGVLAASKKGATASDYQYDVIGDALYRCRAKLCAIYHERRNTRDAVKVAGQAYRELRSARSNKKIAEVPFGYSYACMFATALEANNEMEEAISVWDEVDPTHAIRARMRAGRYPEVIELFQSFPPISPCDHAFLAIALFLTNRGVDEALKAVEDHARRCCSLGRKATRGDALLYLDFLSWRFGQELLSSEAMIRSTWGKTHLAIVTVYENWESAVQHIGARWSKDPRFAIRTFLGKRETRETRHPPTRIERSIDVANEELDSFDNGLERLERAANRIRTEIRSSVERVLLREEWDLVPGVAVAARAYFPVAENDPMARLIEARILTEVVWYILTLSARFDEAVAWYRDGARLGVHMGRTPRLWRREERESSAADIHLSNIFHGSGDVNASELLFHLPVLIEGCRVTDWLGAHDAEAGAFLSHELDRHFRPLGGRVIDKLDPLVKSRCSVEKS